MALGAGNMGEDMFHTMSAREHAVVVSGHLSEMDGTLDYPIERLLASSP